MPSKEDLLKVIAVRRRETHWPNYKNLCDYHDGAYDCDFVSPYTKSAGNVHSNIFIMLQDWASDTFLAQPFCTDTNLYGRTADRATNRTLDALIERHFGISIHETYASNLFPFIKPSGMSSTIPKQDLLRAAEEFALPQIKILEPKLVIALGLSCYNALRYTVQGNERYPMRDAVENPFPFGATTIWCQAHTSPLGQLTRNRGGVDRVSGDWQKMAAWFKEDGEKQAR